MSLVYVKNKKNQTIYVYESTSYWDKEKQQSRNTRECIGKLVDNKFIPNKQYRMQQELEQLKQAKPEAVVVTEFTRKFYGATYLLEQIGKSYGIIEDLKKCFGDTYKQILSLAYFLVLEDNNTISRFHKWATTHVLPYDKTITPQQCGELFQSVSEDKQEQFFILQGRRRKEKEYLAFDISSVSSFVETFRQLRYSEPNEHNPLAKINLTLLYGDTSKMPVCYSKLPAYLSEVSTLMRILKSLPEVIDGKIKFILDRDFYSENTVNDLYTNHYKFLIGTKISLPFVQKHLDPVRATLRKDAHYHSGHQTGYYSVRSEWPHEKVKKRNGEVIRTDKRIYVHLYYNEQQAIDDTTAFNKHLDLLEEELYANKRVPSHEKLYEKYFTIRQRPARKISITLQQAALENKQKDFGYSCLISNDIKDPIEALDIYRSRALVEKSFDNLKERLHRGSPSDASEHNLEGKLFVQFVAHMFVSAIDKTMHEKGLYRTHTMADLLDTLDVIEQFQSPGKSPHIGEVTEKQKTLYAQFGIYVLQ
ncbi:MAG TPA: transposase [Sphaerochaeta sp.]|nr:transposase [Sphaerochaeta sp.]